MNKADYMRDKRPVDELSIQELEQLIEVRKHEARMTRLQHTGHIIARTDKPPVDASGQADTKTSEVQNEPILMHQKRIRDACPEDIPTFGDTLDARLPNHFRPQQHIAKRVLAASKTRGLAVIEFAAAVAIVYLLVALVQTIQGISKTTATIQAQYNAVAKAQFISPTATPFIKMDEAVLPEGHTVRVNEQGVVSAEFNLDEVPAQYREQYRTRLQQTVIPPTPSNEAPVRIQIARIKVDSAVVEGDSWDVLQLGVGHHIGSANSGQIGNMVLSGHNDVYGEVFRDLDQLRPGDQVIVSTIGRSFTYIVRETQIVKPTDVWVMETRGEIKQLTLISCYPYRVDNMRIVVFATLQ